jgi:hypothetical protein
MRPNLVVIASVIPQHAPQLRFVEHDQVIETLAPNRSDELLDVAVLPGERGVIRWSRIVACTPKTPPK